MDHKYDFAHLEKNVSDMIFEGMVKIGYMENKSVSVYYDTGLLGYLLGVPKLEKEQIKSCLLDFKEYVKPRLGKIMIKYAKGRYEVCVLPEGVTYIYENNKSRGFLRNLVAVLQEKDTDLKKITNVFASVSSDFVVEEIDHSEFQYVISFRDKSIDEFYYCFTFDEMGKYYHRLLDYDFEQVAHCECDINHPVKP